MMTGTPESVTLVPISRIEILNSRDRNMKVFEEIVDNIRSIGLKKPITVTERPGADGQVKYLLVCGEGRLNAFRILGESHIPALIVDVSDEDAFIMSLAENIARRGYRPLEILADIELLRKRGYSAEVIIQKTGLSPKYVKDIMFLLDQGEERLIEAVQRGTIPLTTALEIARAKDGDENLGDLLQEAYENGQLKGRQVIEATLLGFDLETYQVPLEQLLPCKKVPDGVMSTRKYKQIVSSIKEIGLIEPLSVIQPDAAKPEFLLLDGHLRALALKELGVNEAPCLFAKDDESYSYNHQINRLSTVQEHYMIRRTIDRGVSKERLARAFNVNLSSINRRINLLEGICPEAIALLQDKQFTPDMTRVLRNMKAARQVEAVELMIASNTITVAHAEALLKATPHEQRTDLPAPERDKKTPPIEQIVKLEKEMSQVQEHYKDAELNYGSDLLNLVLARGYLTKLLSNAAVRSFIERQEPEILEHFELVVNTVSMEEAVQQRQEVESTTISDTDRAA